MGFFRQENWSGLPFPSPGDLPDPRIKPSSPALQADSYHLSHQGSPSWDHELGRKSSATLRAEHSKTFQFPSQLWDLGGFLE